jgi:type VII secretion protein EccCa
MATPPSFATDRFLVHRTARAHPRPAAAGELLLAPPPAVASTGPAATAWLQYLVPLLGGAGSFAFLLAVPGPRHPWLVVAVVGTAVASLALGLALRLAERRAARRARRRERSRYLAHLARIAAAAEDLAAAQLAAADHLHPDPPRLLGLTGRAERLWERRPADDDFLTVRVGRGPVPLAAPLRLAAAAGPLVEHDPELLAAAEALVRRAGWLPDAPVAVPLRRLGVVAVSGPRDRVRALARALVCQLAVLHAPDDLRILAGFPPAALPAWEWLKWLPHARDPAPGVDGPPSCLLAGTRGQLAALLDREVRRRLAAGPAAFAGRQPPAGGPLWPHLVAVVEVARGGRRASEVAPLEELLDRAVEAGASVVWLTDDPAGEPSELAARLLLDEHGSATFEETAPGGRRIGAIRADALGPAVCETVARRLAPLRLDRRPGVVEPGPVRLLDLLGAAGAPDGPAGWRHADRSGLLRVPVGVRPGGEPVLLDLKEAAEGGVGPHGLVVGATGSGKSELLRTIVAGLAATHPPELLAFVLVDFKGGAAFASLAALPQVAGLITNLQVDLSTVDRARAALQGEQERRQRLLREAGNQPDLRAYAARRAADPTLPALPHLLVVVDEFGELLDARPDFLDLFVAVGRVGRSLGMHLLLASQRLDEGRLRGLDGHLRYRVCLRTFSAAESSNVQCCAHHGCEQLVDRATGAAGRAVGLDASRPIGGRDRRRSIGTWSRPTVMLSTASRKFVRVGMRPSPGAPGTPRAPRHCLWVLGACVLGVVVAGAVVVLGTVPAGAVEVGTPSGAGTVVVGAGPDGDVDVVDVAGARVAGGADRSAPATTIPTDVLASCRGRLPTRLASGCLATASTPVIAPTAIPKATTAATATRCQRIGCGGAWLAASSLAPACSPTRRTRERRATLWADASERVYRASAGATSRLTSAAPMRVPSIPKKDATTAPLTAASASASSLGTRSCSMPHLEVWGWDGVAVWGPRARPDWTQPPPREPTLATEAGSHQVPRP